MQYEFGETIYENSLTDPTDIVGFRMEGDAAVTFRSFPAEKAWSPAPVRIATQSSGLASNSSKTLVISSVASACSALRRRAQVERTGKAPSRSKELTEVLQKLVELAGGGHIPHVEPDQDVVEQGYVGAALGIEIKGITQDRAQGFSNLLAQRQREAARILE